MIHFSDSAISEIQRLKLHTPEPGNYFRLSVVQDGCAGLAYNLQFDDQLNTNDQQVTIDDLTVVIDAASVEHTQGIEIDYTEDLMGGGFQFSNPQAKRTCSCGISFALSADNTDEWSVDCGL